MHIGLQTSKETFGVGKRGSSQPLRESDYALAPHGTEPYLSGSAVWLRARLMSQIAAKPPIRFFRLPTSSVASGLHIIILTPEPSFGGILLNYGSQPS